MAAVFRQTLPRLGKLHVRDVTVASNLAAINNPLLSAARHFIFSRR